MGLRNERVIGLEADYVQICRFSSTTGSIYKRVLKRLEAVAQELGEQDSKRGESAGLT